MELKVNLRLQTILEFINFVQRMELETAIWIVISVLMTPLVLLSIGKLGLAIIWQLFWLGVNVGIMISVVSGIYLFALTCTGTWKKAFPLVIGGGGHKNNLGESGRPKCTMLDVILSMIFHSGVSFPEIVWNPLMDLCVRQRGKSVPLSSIIYGGGKQKVVVKQEPIDEDSEDDPDDDDFYDVFDSHPNSSRPLQVIITSPQRKKASPNTTAEIIEQLVESRIKPSPRLKKAKAAQVSHRRRNRAKSTL